MCNCYSLCVHVNSLFSVLTKGKCLVSGLPMILVWTMEAFWVTGAVEQNFCVGHIPVLFGEQCQNVCSKINSSAGTLSVNDICSNCCAVLPSTGAAGMQEKTLFVSQLFTHYVECHMASDWRFCIVSTLLFCTSATSVGGRPIVLSTLCLSVC